MTIEVLVMCGTCGRPQPPRGQCVQCGSDLPTSPLPVDVNAQPPHPPTAEAPVEFDLGDGRKLVVSTDSVELQGTPDRQTSLAPRPVANAMGIGGPARVPLSTVRRAKLEQLRAWPAVVLGVFSLGLMVAVSGWLARTVGAVGLAAAIWLFVRTRYFVIRFDRNEGAPAVLVLGGGASGSRRGVTAQSLWLDLSAELRRRGVRIDA